MKPENHRYSVHPVSEPWEAIKARFGHPRTLPSCHIWRAQPAYHIPTKVLPSVSQFLAGDVAGPVATRGRARRPRLSRQYDM